MEPNHHLSHRLDCVSYLWSGPDNEGGAVRALSPLCVRCAHRRTDNGESKVRERRSAFVPSSGVGLSVRVRTCSMDRSKFPRRSSIRIGSEREGQEVEILCPPVRHSIGGEMENKAITRSSATRLATATPTTPPWYSMT